jgi:hypothetical protein
LLGIDLLYIDEECCQQERSSVFYLARLLLIQDILENHPTLPAAAADLLQLWC